MTPLEFSLNMTQNAFFFPTIEPLVVRHSDDAAFYWSQIDRTATSPHVTFEKIEHFNRLLDTHLSGLEVAGPAGWIAASRALNRWKKNGEVFVCIWLAAQHADATRLDEVMQLVSQRPNELLRGTISALAWLDEKIALPIIGRLSATSAGPISNVAALRSALLIGPAAITAMPNPLSFYLTSSDPHVRAAACRASVLDSKPTLSMPLLRAALRDTDLVVRAESAIALSQLGDVDVIVGLRECILIQVKECASATGWNRLQSDRRLHRWALHLACIAPLGSPVVAEMIAQLPRRTALDFAMWHGDLSLLPFIGSQTNDPAISRYAGWVWQTLSGIDIAASGWTVSEHDNSMNDSDGSTTQHDADSGLPLPDYAALQGYGVSNFDKNYTQSVRMIFGHNLDMKNAVRLIKTAPQLIRSLVATLVNQLPSGIRISVRAPAVRQRIAMNALHRSIVEEGTK